MSWRVVVIAVACVAVICSHAAADNISPRLSNQIRDQAMLKLGMAEHDMQQHRYLKALSVVEDLLSEPIMGEHAPWIELDIAIANAGADRHAMSLPACAQLAMTYKSSLPLVGAWAQAYAGVNLENLGRDREAMQAYREVESYLPTIADLGPLLVARHKAGSYFLRNSGFDPSNPDHPQILGFDPADKDAWAWAKACVCSTQARHGDVEAAYKGYEELAFSLPASDRRIAIAAVDIAISEIEAYDDWQMMEWVEHAECMIRDTETLFPSEQ